MKRSLLAYAGAVALAACLAATGRATILYSQDFDVDDTANWTVNDPALSDILVDFHYDYSAIGVPPAPGGSSTRGIKMTANNTGGVFSGFSVSPTGQTFAGAYRVEFNLWQNYVGPVGPGGNGTTQLSTFGIGTAGTVPFWPGAAVKESVTFAATLDGGSAADYRAYSSAAPLSYASGDAVYQAPGGAINNSNTYYTTAFPPVSAPAAQVALFPGQTGSTDPGEISFTWRRVVIEVNGGNATWTVDGVPIAVVPMAGLTLGGGNILFGHSDTNAGSSNDPNDTLLNVTLIDNVTVTQIPEPSTFVLSGLALAALGAIRRRCA
ncbi:MAG: PEP-CTERM sorting domain-containing protein [Pirellulales bacterium]|nr:PEP-CTERM sorting domain-containing protein [Pirellulales bacterium]